MAFPSVYEMNNLLTTVRKQHFWEYFSGATLNSRWTQQGSGTPSMVDEADEGFQFISTGGDAYMAFNNIRSFSPTASVFIAEAKRTASNGLRTGLRGNNGTSNTQVAYVNEWSSNSNLVLRTGDASSDSDATSTSLVPNTNWNNYKIECTSSQIKLSVNGVLDIEKTSNRPTIGLQPFVGGYNSTSRFKYLECYNT